MAQPSVTDAAAGLLSDQRRFITYGNRMKENGFRESSIPAVMQMLCVENRPVRQLMVEHLGAIDILVNNAGGGVVKPLVDTQTAEWLDTLNVNATSVFLFSREVAKRMIPRRAGRIVNLSSIAGRRPAAGIAAYAASKFAAVGLTEVLARELKRHGISVYSLCPGAVDTELRRAAVPEEDRSRIMKPEDVAALVTFLVGGGGEGLRELELEIF